MSRQLQPGDTIQCSGWFEAWVITHEIHKELDRRTKITQRGSKWIIEIMEDKKHGYRKYNPTDDAAGACSD